MTAIPAQHQASDSARVPGAVYGWAVVLFFSGLLFASGYAAVLGDLAVTAFKHIARAQYELHQATQNVTEDGRLEYAVLLRGKAADDALAAFLEKHEDWGARPASIQGWAVVSAPVENTQAARVLREQPFAKAVLRNRGIWICH